MRRGGSEGEGGGERERVLYVLCTCIADVQSFLITFSLVGIALCSWCLTRFDKVFGDLSKTQMPTTTPLNVRFDGIGSSSFREHKASQQRFGHSIEQERV